MYPNEEEIAICRNCPLFECVEVLERDKCLCPLRIAKKLKMPYVEMLPHVRRGHEAVMSLVEAV